MSTAPRAFLLTAAFVSTLAGATTSLAAERAAIPTKLDVSYTLAMAGIPIGKATWSAEIGGNQYSASASGRASGILAVLVSGVGRITARGVGRRQDPAALELYLLDHARG